MADAYLDVRDFHSYSWITESSIPIGHQPNMRYRGCFIQMLPQWRWLAFMFF